MPAVEVVVDGGRGPVFIKRAISADDGERLSREAAVLRSLAGHPGVVQILSHTGTGPDTELRLRWVGPHTVATIGAVVPVVAAGLLASLSDTVAELHRRSVIHTRLTADHVLLGAGGRPVVCGLAEAGGPSRCSPAGDVAALGRLLADLLAVDDDDVEPIPTRRGWLGRRGWAGYHRRALLTLADHASADEHVSRPTAAALADAIRTAVPDAALPEAAPPPHDGAPPSSGSEAEADAPASVRARSRPDHPAGDALLARIRHLGPAMAVVVGVGLLLVGFRQVAGTSREQRPRSSPPAIAGPVRRSTTTGSPRTSTSTLPAPDATRRPPPELTDLPACRPVANPSADLDGDRCPDPLQLSGDEVTALGVTYRVGKPGDVLRVADWTCDGRATVALLRVNTGDVFVFRQWARLGQALTVRPQATVPGGTGIIATDSDGDGCPELTVERHAGPPQVVTIRSER